MSAVLSSAQVKLTIITNKRPVARRACLSCRDKKIKCDGEPISTLSDGRQSKIVTEKVRVCSNCKFLGIECVFVQSLRGGRRRKRTPPNGEEPPLKTPKVDSAPHVFANGTSALSALSVSTASVQSAPPSASSPTESLSKSHVRSTSNTHTKADLSSFILDKTIEERHRQKLSSPTLTNSSFFAYDRKDIEGTPTFSGSHSSSASFRNSYSPTSQPPHHLPPPPFYGMHGGKHPRGPGFGPPPPHHHHPGPGPPLQAYLNYPLPPPLPLAPGSQPPLVLGQSSVLSPFSGAIQPPFSATASSQLYPYTIPGYLPNSAPPSDAASSLSPKQSHNVPASVKSPTADPKLNGASPWPIPQDHAKTPVAETYNSSNRQPSEADVYKISAPSEIRPSDLVSVYGYGAQQQQNVLPPPHTHHPYPPPFHGHPPPPYHPLGPHRRHHHHHHGPPGPLPGHPPPPPHLFYGFYGPPPHLPPPPPPPQHHHYYISRGNGPQREDYDYYASRPGYWPYPYPPPQSAANEEPDPTSKPLTKESLENNDKESGMAIDNLVSSENNSQSNKEKNKDDNVSMSDPNEKERQLDTKTKVKSSIGFINNETISPKVKKNVELEEDGKVTESDKAATNSLVSSSSSSTSTNYENSYPAYPPKISQANGEMTSKYSSKVDLADRDTSSNATTVPSPSESEDFAIKVVLPDEELAKYDLPPFEDLKKYLRVFYKYVNSQSRILMDVDSFLSHIVIRFDSASLHALIASVCGLAKLIYTENSFKHPIHDESHWLKLVFEYWENLNDNGMLLSYSLISLTSTVRYSVDKRIEINSKMADLIHENGFIDKVNHLPKSELNKRQLLERHLLSNLLWDFYINHIVFTRFLTGEPFKKLAYDNFEDNCRLDSITIAKGDLSFQIIGPWRDLINKEDSLSDFEMLVYATKRLEAILDAELKGEKLEIDVRTSVPMYHGPRSSIGDRANFVGLTAFVTELFLALRDTWIFAFFNQQVVLHLREGISAHLLRGYDELVTTIKAMTAEKWATFFHLFDVSLDLYDLLEDLINQPGIPDDGLYVASLLFGMACSHKFYSSFISFPDEKSIVVSHFGGSFQLPETLQLRSGVIEEFKIEKLDKRVENLKNYMESKLRFVTEERTRQQMTSYISKLEHYVVDMLNSINGRDS